MKLEIKPIKLPLIKKGDKLPLIIHKHIEKHKKTDILVVSQTIISKAEGRTKNLETIEPTKEAKKIAEKTNKKPEICQLILNESEIIALGENYIITNKNGLICANAQIDQSNAGPNKAILPPKNPEKTAKKIHKKTKTPTIITDSIGRPFRKGAVGTAIAYSGIKPISNYTNKKDLYNQKMKTTTQCVADELASAANIVMGESNQQTPIAIIKGFKHHGKPTNRKINRKPTNMIFTPKTPYKNKNQK
ncbi:F(420)-0:gamma-glutamyl ligase F420 coenzyme biosynthesis enzyme CofE [Methanonatronarchaeum thermophilum]|uniref:F(420)-0:gamma-glutamyl ligase F420 coenzyme biosynthesis enzyme CofE n=1 Tax=Methanonatronarchaeum thermophilum TaxID=1927129 RepID=A0A1Y3GB65_9EURY|nr:coenzyme F420-0:L-glutamate ligase [Methanonatronarchaeum thermophilum]OUJ18668.1 F(420)-0:gamma-glutamyl ligase F420 coenzyme biosynthesis enzyme CofE [Methanonatronarchaeum thermophilum]